MCISAPQLGGPLLWAHRVTAYARSAERQPVRLSENSWWPRDARGHCSVVLPTSRYAVSIIIIMVIVNLRTFRSETGVLRREPARRPCGVLGKGHGLVDLLTIHLPSAEEEASVALCEGTPWAHRLRLALPTFLWISTAAGVCHGMLTLDASVPVGCGKAEHVLAHPSAHGLTSE